MNSGLNTLGSELKASIGDPITNGILELGASMSTLSAQMALLMAPKKSNVATKASSLNTLLTANDLWIGGGLVLGVLVLKRLKHHH